MSPKIERALVVTVAIIAVIVIGIVIWGKAEYRGYIKAKAESNVFTAQYEAKAAQAETMILALQRESAILRAEKQRALDNADLHEADAAKARAETERLKAQTAAMSPDGLSDQINLRIGTGAITPTAGGLYICSRAGTEAILNRFLDGEGYLSQYESEKAANLNLRAATDAAERMAANSAQAFTLMQGERDRALVAWDADKQVIKHLERSIVGRRLKSFVIGAAVGVASVLIFQLAKGK